jgi:uncharacterized protein (DUF1330 family)
MFSGAGLRISRPGYPYRQFALPYIIGSARGNHDARKEEYSSTREDIVKTNYKLVIALVAGTAIGGAATQGLHAQAKLKAYSVGELEVTGAMDPSYLPAVRKAIEEAHGHAIRTLNGRVVSIEGPPAPKNVAIIEWDSVDDAVAFYKSKAWNDLAPLRDKSQKTIRRYVVEVEK